MRIMKKPDKNTMQQKKAALVINPRTGQNVTSLPDMLSLLSAAGWQTDIALKEYGGHAMELAQNFSQRGSDLIVGYGGDGTVNQVVNGVMHEKKNRSTVGVIPGGTANLWAGDIGVPTNPVKAMLALIDSDVRKVDVGRVSVQEITFPADAEHAEHTVANVDQRKATQKKIQQKTRNHFLLMAGFGFDAAVMNDVSKALKYHIGPAAVGLSMARNLPTHQPFPLELHALGKQGEDQVLWKGDALQVIIGNTRRYAMVLETTPNAYIDDGVLDVCVITAGDPLTTLQQVSSLLFHRKHEMSTITENFQGSHLVLKLPASIPFEVDGSSVKLTDFLGKDDAARLKQMDNVERVMVTYRLDALPHALNMAIPRTYDDELFAHEHTDSPNPERVEHGEQADIAHRHHHDDILQTVPQEETERLESQPEHSSPEAEHPKHGVQDKQDQETAPEPMRALLHNGRKATVIGKVPDPRQPGTYIIAAQAHQARTGDIKPVAVVISKDTITFNHQGDRVAVATVKDLHEGMEIVVEGKQSKRGVIRATRAVL